MSSVKWRPFCPVEDELIVASLHGLFVQNSAYQSVVFVIFRDDGVAYNEYFPVGCCVTDLIRREPCFFLQI